MSMRTANANEYNAFFDNFFEDWDAHDEPVQRRTVSPSALTITIVVGLLLVVCLATLVALGLIASPPSSASGASGTQSAAEAIVTEADSAALLTANGIETSVTDLWARSGDKGTVLCPTDFSTAPGTLVTCSGELKGTPLTFTVAVAAPAAGHVPFTFVSWTSAATN